MKRSIGLIFSFVLLAFAVSTSSALSKNATDSMTSDPTQNSQITLIYTDNNWYARGITFSLNSYDDVIELLPGNIPLYSRLAEGYLTRGNLTAALNCADDKVTVAPFNPDAWATRALVYSWSGDYAEGIASGQEALALDPQNVRANAYLGYAYFQAGEYNLANDRVEDAITLDPEHWSGYWVRGLILENATIDITAAQADYEQAYNLALKQNPAMAGIVVSSLARTYIAFQDAPHSVQILNEYLTTIDDSNREALYWLGMTHYIHLGEWSQALDAFSDCVNVAPDDVICWYMLGRTHNSLGDQDSALEAFEETVELNSPYARHYWWAAYTERSLGNCEGAAEYLEVGYDMAITGGLSAIDEGNNDLISDFEAEMANCHIVVGTASTTSTPFPESTNEYSAP